MIFSSDIRQSKTFNWLYIDEILLNFSLTVKAAPHECVIRTSQP